MKRALAREIRPATSLIYDVGDKVYYKRRQVFVKHVGVYVRVNPCHLRYVNENNQLKNDTTVSVAAEDSRTINQKENNAKAVEKKGRLDPFDEASDDDDDDDDDDVAEAEISEGNEGELVDGNDQEEVLDNLAEEQPQEVRQQVELFHDNSQEEEPSHIDQMEQRAIGECTTQMGSLSSTSFTIPKKGTRISYKIRGNNFYDEATILGRAEKATGKNKHWINTEGSDKCLKSLDLEQAEDLRELEENIYLTALDTNDVDVRQAMLVELENWKHRDVYSEVEDNGQLGFVLVQGGLSQESMKMERKW